MAESLIGWKAGKLRKAADLVSEVGGSSVFGASAVFCAGSVCCVLILAAHDVSVDSCAAVENAALADSAENGAAAAGSGSLAAGTPAARDGTSVAAASAEIGTGIGKVSQDPNHWDWQIRKKVHLMWQEGGEGSTLCQLTALTQETMLCPGHHWHHRHHQQRGHLLHHRPRNHHVSLCTLATGQNPGIDCVSLVACRSLIPFFLLLPLRLIHT